jgi:hypothetical protein
VYPMEITITWGGILAAAWTIKKIVDIFEED